MNFDVGVGKGVLLFVLYWWLLFRLADMILEAPKLKKSHRLLIGIVNAAIVFYAYTVFGSVFLSYFFMITLMLAEFLVFYKDKFLGALLCALACSIHVLSFFMLTTGSLSLITKYAPYEILTGNKLLVLAVVLSFAILNLSIVGAMRFVPLLQVKVINQHKEQQWFIISWMAVNNVFLLYEAYMLSGEKYPVYASGNQMAASLATMISLYIVLFFSIKTSVILGYKEKNAELEQAINMEQQYRSSMMRDAIATYEVNVTQDIIVKGFETLGRDRENLTSCYSDMLTIMTRKLIYSEDADDFIRTHERRNIIHLFESGKHEIIAEYRRLLDSGDYIWVRTFIHLAQDIESGDIKAFVCAKNVDVEKKKQLEMQHKAERDPLTGIYNRGMLTKLIDENLIFKKNPQGSTLFMIDVDKFKGINDHLGHVYGDAVLCELADKLVQIFRSTDIVGRVGGDEFIVFLKDDTSVSKAEGKAADICKAFANTYKGADGEEHRISGSIGIAFFPRDGNSFKELYGKADVALYEAKNAGGNGYRICEGESFKGRLHGTTEIQAIGNLTQKGFRQNRIEYIFKMLYQSENPVLAIHSALKLVADHFSFERGYIFETSKDGKTSSNTFEWCAKEVTPQRENLQNLPIKTLATAYSHFRQNGTFILKSINELPPTERAVLEPQGIKSMFQFGIFDKNHLLGLIGFDNCRKETVPNLMEVDEMTTICNILATFFVKHHIDEVSSRDLLARQEVMNQLDNFIYIINMETFEVLFMNEKIQKLVNKANDDRLCYSFFRGQKEQCPDCPLLRMNGSSEKVVSEIYNEALKIWMETTASTLRWTDGSLVCLLNCTDITKQKEAHLAHIHQLEKLAYVDELTGCRTYHKFKEDAWKILNKQPELTHFLVKLDINNFKLVNQIYGYDKGNEILCCLAKAIKETTRNEDEIYARVNNDEFIALFAIRELEDIEELYNKFLHNFWVLVGEEFAFKFNFPHGRYVIYPYNQKRMDINDMFEKVNTAHKEAKLDKTLEFAFYDERMTRDALHVKEVENKMAHALENNKFSVYFQPKYHLEDETIGGGEALVRWEDSNKDLFSPRTFIPIFEQNGFITKLDFYVFRRVCHIIKEWIEAGIEPVKVSVNFSRLHLGNVNFVKELCEMVDSVGINRKYLEIEITETVIYDNIGTLEVLLHDLHKGGFSMSMDDFGSGYSSLGMLKNLPVDVIKIDRSFFANQRDTERSKIVVGSIIQMAAGLGIKIVAEGVEEQVQINFLRELHCDMVQGYYYARPMPAEAFTELLIGQRGNGDYKK